MKYMGSKNRIAKHILPIILKDRREGQWYVEPFVGGANMIDKVDGKRLGADNNEYLIALLNKMSKEVFKSPKIDEQKYKNIKNNKENYPLWVVGYAGFQLSFGAMWFGSYRRDKQGKRDYCKEAQNNINKQSKKLKEIIFVNQSYQDLEIPPNSLIYCDPPYEGTAKYKANEIEFNYIEFWDWVREKSKQGNKVYVSEYNAPDDFKCVWKKELINGLSGKKATEKLFIYKG